MKLWLDDLRPHPKEFTRAYSAGEAIRILQTGEVTFASLDYDILWDAYGDPENWQDTKTGYAVVAWMAEHNVWPRDGVAVHSANKAGRERMIALIPEIYRRKA